MKKTIALLLLLAVVFAISAAAAASVEIYREEELFYITVDLPAGARVEGSVTDDTFSRTDIKFITGGKPTVVVTAAPDETYTGLSLSDLSEEDVNMIIQNITLEMAQPQADIYQSPSGYEYIVCNETTAINDTCDTIMLINGYFIMVHVFYEDNSELTEEDMTIGPTIVESLQFIGNANS